MIKTLLSRQNRHHHSPLLHHVRSSAHSAVILWHAVLSPSCIFCRLERQSASTPLPPAPHHDRGSSDIVAVVVDLIQSNLFVAYTVNETEHDEIVVSNKNNELI